MPTELARRLLPLAGTGSGQPTPAPFRPAMSQVFSGLQRRSRDAGRERTCGSQSGPQPVSRRAARLASGLAPMRIRASPAADEGPPR
jgi:hypothetical protein